MAIGWLKKMMVLAAAVCGALLLFPTGVAAQKEEATILYSPVKRRSCGDFGRAAEDLVVL